MPPEGWFCAPVIATGLPGDSPLLHEEIFGPVLAVEAVRDVDAACDRVDELPFALTGGLYCRNPRTVEHVVRRSPVGNLYVNRAVTGAMVGRQPFGGNRLSGGVSLRSTRRSPWRTPGSPRSRPTTTTRCWSSARRSGPSGRSATTA